MVKFTVIHSLCYIFFKKLVKVADPDYDAKKELTNERPAYAVIDQW